MSTVVEMKGATDTFAVVWAVKMLNFLGLSDIILQCDPEPSLIKWAESVKSKRQERTVIRSSPTRSHQRKGGVENYQKQLQGQVRTMLAAMQERTQYRPPTDRALMKSIVRHAPWLIPRFRCNDSQPPSHGKLLEFGETVLAHLPKVRKESGNPAPKLAETGGHPPSGWAKGTSRTNTNTLSEHSWSEENLRSVVETPQKPRSTATDDSAGSFRQCQKDTNTTTRTRKRTRTTTRTRSPQTSQRMTTMQGEMLPEPDTTTTTPGTSRTSRGEKRTETQGNVFVKKRLTMKSPKQPVTPVPPPEDPVKRRLMKKSQRKDNLVMNVVADLLNTVNTLLSDETVPETNPCEDSEPPNMLTIRGDPTEKMKRRQTELNSLK